jgi:hypothetical protein
MTLLQDYLQDGANYQARAVLMFLQRNANIEDSWNSTHKEYEADIKVARWENCREQGYVISLKNKDRKQLNIAFFEHRNSDSICAIKWEQNSINSLSIETADFKGECYKDKYDVSFSVDYGKVCEMAEWINEELILFWKEAELKTS